MCVCVPLRSTACLARLSPNLHSLRTWLSYLNYHGQHGCSAFWRTKSHCLTRESPTTFSVVSPGSGPRIGQSQALAIAQG